MANTIDKSLNSPPLKTQRCCFVTQILFRILAIAATLAAAWLMLTNKQTADVYGFQVDARYTYSPAFKFFTIANMIAFAFSVLSLLPAFILAKTRANPTYYFYLFLHDLIISVLLMAGCVATTAIGYVGKYGNTHTGWMPICDHFAKFCNRTIAAAAVSYVGFIFYLILAIVSAKNLHKINA